jgi:hypothetical protein
MQTVPLEIRPGEDFYLPINWQDEVCGMIYPLDISGYQVDMQISYEPFTAITPICEVSTENYIYVDGPDGLIEITIPNSITQNLPIGCYNYAIKITSNFGLVERILGGKFEIKGW